MGAGEIVVIIMLVVGSVWIAAKTIGFVWRFIGPPVLSFMDRFFVVTSTSGADDDMPGAGIGSGVVVPRQQHQAAPELVQDFEAVKAYLTDHTLTDQEAIELLALARRSNGDDLVSANKIRDIVGGNEGKVKAHVAAFRRHRPKPRPATRIERPANGWPSA